MLLESDCRLPASTSPRRVESGNHERPALWTVGSFITDVDVDEGRVDDGPTRFCIVI